MCKLLVINLFLYHWDNLLVWFMNPRNTNTNRTQPSYAKVQIIISWQTVKKPGQTWRRWVIVVTQAPTITTTNTVNKKVQLDATICRHLFAAKSLYMFRASQHPSSGALKTLTATSGIGHNTTNIICN